MTELTSVECVETPEKNRELLNFLQRQTMPGDIQLMLDCSPNFFESLEVEGQKVKVMSLREQNTGELMCMGCMAEKVHWINGQEREEKIGYISSLRVDKKFRAGGLFYKAYSYLQSEHEKNHPDRIYLSTILEENTIAKKILTTDRPGLPHYTDWGLLSTSFLPVNKQIWKNHFADSSEVILRPATAQDIPALAAFWKKESHKRQFVPAYTEQDFNQPHGILRGLKMNDILLALHHEKIIGCIALWDQSAYRRWVVAAYSKKMKMAKGLYNIVAPLLNRPKLPKEHEPFYYKILSLIAIQNDDVKIFESLLYTLWNREHKVKDLVISIGFHETDPLFSLIRPKKTQKLLSRLYLSHWKDDRSMAKQLVKDLPPYVEFGSL